MPKNDLPSEQMPKNLESLSEPERTVRLSHQIGLMYDRVMLTGDWEGQHLKHPETGNIFDDIRYVASTRALAEGIDAFLDKAKDVIPDAVNPEDLSGAHERRDFNRRLFIEVLKYSSEVLRGGNKDQILELEKTIDDNVRYFRDTPLPLPGGHVKFDIRRMKNANTSEEDSKITEGLKRMTDSIVASIDIAQLDNPPPKTL